MRRVIIIILTAVSFCFSFEAAQAVENNELIRASVIEKIARFIEWPNSSQQQFTLCAFENTPLLPALEVYYASGSTLDGKPIKLAVIDDVNKVLECQIIYLGDDEFKQLAGIRQLTQGYPVLIVSEKKDSVSQGAHADFFVEDNRLHLEVNRTALSNSNLKASYHLLGVARIVE